MVRSPCVRAATAATAVLALAAGPLCAQTARSGGGASAALMQQMQQLASERTELQEELARTKKDLEAMRKERDDLKKGQQAVDQRAKVSAAALAQSASQKAAAEQEATQTKAKMQELVAKFRETLQTMRQIETEGAATKQALAARDQQLKTCVDRNAALYKLNGDILTRWEHESSWSRMERVEAVTKIKRVELENLVDDYRGQADDLRVHPGAPPAPRSGSPPAPAAAPPPTPAAPPTPPPTQPAPQAEGGPRQ
jgi:multidrug efflux pump subunit AcrA (membrane-fusion protein)